MGRNSVNTPSSSGVALTSSTGWFAVCDENDEIIGERLFGSSFRAAEWASAKFDRSWPELHRIGFTVRGGFDAADCEDPSFVPDEAPVQS